MEIEKSAGAIIYFIKEDIPYFLMLEYETYWGFVRGQIEKNEKTEETIKREAKEEANISKLIFLEGFKEIQGWFYRFKGQLVRKSAIYLLAEISEEQAKEVRISFEHKSFRFAKLSEALELMRIKNEKLMLEKAAEFIEEHKKQKKLL
jgi:8-oxo-dGTP pyrophosphatase MutT (NUDIX family)